MPLCVYDNPGTTHFAFSDDLHAQRRGAARTCGRSSCPAQRRGGADRRAAAARSRGVALGVSGDQFAAGALNAGADVWFSVLGGLFPEAALAIVREARGRRRGSSRCGRCSAATASMRVVATAAALLGLAGEHNLPRPLRLLDGDARTELEAALRRSTADESARRAGHGPGAQRRQLEPDRGRAAAAERRSRRVRPCSASGSSTRTCSCSPRCWSPAACSPTATAAAARCWSGSSTFAAGSLACALVSDPGLLIAARVLQALGPPLILPASLSIVAATFADPLARARAIGAWGAGSGFGIAVGPLLGGVIVSGLGWRWAFGLSAGRGARCSPPRRWRSIPRDRPPAPARRFDLRRRAARHERARRPRVRPDRRPVARLDVARRAARVRRDRRARPARSSGPSAATPRRSSTSNWSAARCSPRPTSRPRR